MKKLLHLLICKINFANEKETNKVGGTKFQMFFPFCYGLLVLCYLQPVNRVKYLALRLDRKLSWKKYWRRESERHQLSYML